MVRAAQREQVVGLVVASVYPRAEMMHIDEGGVPTARYLAAMLIAQQHRATNGRRNRLRGALTMGHSSVQLACDFPRMGRRNRRHFGRGRCFTDYVDLVFAAAALILRRSAVTRTRLRVDLLDVLRIAARHFRNFRRNLQRPSEAGLRGPRASFADRQRNLVAGSPVVDGPAENVPCHQQ
jgi:hypothetical protein